LKDTDFIFFLYRFHIMASDTSIHEKFQRLFSLEATEENIPEDENGYKLLLDQIKITDFSDLERSGCVTITNYPSTTKIPLIVFLPRLGMNAISHLNSMENKSSNDSIIIQKVLLYFIKNTHDVMLAGRYVLVYGHTPLAILSQQTMIFKYYKLLPRPYKKNLQNLVILHPQFGIKMVFEFAKVFLSDKFYQKLILVNSIQELQSMVSPDDLTFPYKFIKLEDEYFDCKYSGSIPALCDCYFPILGTTKLLCDCINYLRNHGGFKHVGIFRISGDENILNLAKIRMQKAASKCYPNFPIYHDKIVIGIEAAIEAHQNAIISNESDLDDRPYPSIAPDEAVGSRSASPPPPPPSAATSSSAPTSPKSHKVGSEKVPKSPKHSFFRMIPESKSVGAGISRVLKTFKRSPVNSQKLNLTTEPNPNPEVNGGASSSSDPATSSQLAAIQPLLSPLHQTSSLNNLSSFSSGSGSSLSSTITGSSTSAYEKLATVVFSDIDIIAQIIKFSLRELPEPLITFDAFQVLIEITRRVKKVSIGSAHTELSG
jgi:hypothetical protein